ncbi:MAG: CRTAC1 family protein [Sulfitobacter sp.]
MRTLLLVFAVIGHGAGATPLFKDRSDGLPSHIYDGGWEHFVGGGVAIFDCNGDGLPDLFAAGGENPAQLMVNQGDFIFESSRIPDLRGVTGAYPLDMDNDGYKDLFVLRVGANVTLKGAPDCRFSDATSQWGIPQDDRWSTAFSAWWAQGTDKPTLAIGNYVDRQDPEGPFEACDDNALLWPTATGYRETLLTPGFCPLSILAAQDARGAQTLRLSNDRHYYVKGGYEQMWDIPSQRFLDASDGWDTVALWGMGIASRDLTGDGRDEVMLTSMGDQLMQFATPEGRYTAAPYAIGTYSQRPHTGGDGRPSTGWHAEFADVDNDGQVDLFIAKGNVDQMPGMATRDPNNLLIQNPDGTFTETAAQAGIATMARSRGAGLADFDGDGRLDLVVMNRRAAMELYQNVTPQVGNWVRIDLTQAGSNRDAIGARVTVQSADQINSVQRVVGGGHAGGQLLPLHFGLGAETTADVTVTWPDGSQSKQTLDRAKTHVVSKP